MEDVLMHLKKEILMCWASTDGMEEVKVGKR